MGRQLVCAARQPAAQRRRAPRCRVVAGQRRHGSRRGTRLLPEAMRRRSSNQDGVCCLAQRQAHDGGEPLLRDRDHLTTCPNGFARESHPCSFDDLGMKEPIVRAGQGMVAEDVDEHAASERGRTALDGGGMGGTDGGATQGAWVAGTVWWLARPGWRLTRHPRVRPSLRAQERAGAGWHVWQRAIAEV